MKMKLELDPATFSQLWSLVRLRELTHGSDMAPLLALRDIGVDVPETTTGVQVVVLWERTTRHVSLTPLEG
ncbi:MAG: hypothetical protein AB1698_01525 [Pseudomonadota bacterium]